MACTSDDWEAAGPASGEPQCSQNREVASSTGVPQAGHPGTRVEPQAPQKRAPTRTALPQDGQGAVAPAVTDYPARSMVLDGVRPLRSSPTFSDLQDS